VLAGFPTVDFKYSLVDGKYHDVDSSALAFEIAAKACFREGMKKAGPTILEPIMDVEVTTPSDHVGDVVGDLNRRRGVIQSQDMAGTSVIVRAHVPLKEMFGYISNLRGMTKGRASFSMQFHHYDPCRATSRTRSWPRARRRFRPGLNGDGAGLAPRRFRDRAGPSGRRLRADLVCCAFSSKRDRTALAAGGTTETSRSGPAKASTASQDANRMMVTNSTSPPAGRRRSSRRSRPPIPRARMPGKTVDRISAS
jgi:hypothetical protein